jgi:hypothetical protein
MTKTYAFTHKTPTPTILNSLTLNEIVDRDLLIKLINSKLLKTEFHNPYVKYENERKQLEKYLKGVDKKGNKKVSYVRPSNIEYGRVNPKQALGLHSIRREIRHTLLRDNFTDIDIVNAHPVILLQICKKLNIECKRLNTYVKKRKEIREKLNTVYQLDNKDISKKLIISLINMASYDKWITDNKLEKYGKIKYIEDLCTELKIICDSLIKVNPKMYNDIVEHKKNKGNIKASFMSYYLQTIENDILEHIYTYCKNNNIIPDDNCILSNDGVMILKSKYNPKLLKEFSSIIKKKMDLDIEYINKPYDEGYTIEQIEANQKTNITNEIFEELELSSHQYFSDLFYQLNDFKYIYHDTLGWFEYDEHNKLKRFEGLPTGMNNNISKTLQDYLKMEYAGLDPEDKNFIKYSKIYKSNYKQVGNTKFIKDIIEKLKDHYNIPDLDKKIDSKLELVAFKDLVYNVHTKQYRPILRNDYVEKHINYYAPTTDDEDIKNDILQFVQGIQKTQEEADFLLKITANALFKNKYEKLYIFQGRGGNGKGLYMSLVEKAFQSYCKTASSTFLTGKYKAGAPNAELYACMNKKLVIVNEPEESDGDGGLKFNIEFFKKITSCDTISTRGLRRDAVEFEANFNTFIQCNDIPELDKLDNAIKRRIVILKFPYNFSESPNPDNEYDKLADYTLKDTFKDNEEYHRQFIKILLDNSRL